MIDGDFMPAGLCQRRLARFHAVSGRGSCVGVRIGWRGKRGHGAPHWSYEGQDGPSYWPRLSPEYSACGIGKLQSPIDVPSGAARDSRLDSIEFDYETTPLRVIDNGHTVQVDFGPGNEIRIGALRYDLKQLHFHMPSEERIDGKRYPMVVHVVDKNKEGRIAVVAVLLEEGRENRFFANVLRYTPLDKGVERTVLYRPVNALNILPVQRSYYAFAGLVDDAAVQRGRELVRAATSGPGFTRATGRLQPSLS